MGEMSKAELSRIIKAHEAGGVYYIYGTDDYTIGRMKNALVDSIIDRDAQSLNLHRFEGKDGTDVMIQACEALPVFSEKMCVTVCDFDLEAVKPGAAALKELYEEIKNLPDSTVLIFYTLNADICGGKKNPTEKNRKLTDLVAKVGTTVRIDIPSPSEAAKEIMAMFSEEGGRIGRKAAEFLFARTGDLSAAANEVGKLTAYADGREVTQEDVALLTPENDDTKIYALSDAVTAHDLSRALDVYNRLIDNRSEPVALLYMLTGSMNDIYRARIALDAGKTANDVISDFSYPRNLSFRVNNAFLSAQRTNTGYLRRCMQRLCKADTDIKGGTGKPETILENAVIKMLTLKAK
ncbi:MAG: DNA polymerase III subunit delta [Oscillospiraceae bacterium]|nr:DNA polymerase III subunit delta [Oscillospiraceae bacterium]